jgi:hypothetical protein
MRKKLSIAGLKRRDPEEVKARKSEAAKLRWSKVSEIDKKHHMTNAINAQSRTIIHRIYDDL